MSAWWSPARPKRCRTSRTARCGSRRTGARARATTSTAACRSRWSFPQEGVIGLLDVGLRAGRREEQEARLRVPQLAARPATCSAPGRSPTSAARRGRGIELPAEVRRQPDRHQGADRQDPVPGLETDRRAAQGLDLEVAGDHGAEPQRCRRRRPGCWSQRRWRCCWSFSSCRTRCCSRPASSSPRRSSSPASSRSRTTRFLFTQAALPSGFRCAPSSSAPRSACSTCCSAFRSPTSWCARAAAGRAC